MTLSMAESGVEAPAARQQSSGGSFISKIMPGPRRHPRPQRQAGEARNGAPGPRLRVLQEGRPQPTPVTTGASDGVKTQILGGQIEPGQLVIIGQEENAG